MVIIGLLAGLGVPRFSEMTEGARVVRAIGDLRTLSQALVTLDSLPASLADIGFINEIDPWGNPYVYYRFPPAPGRAPPPGARKDRFLVPINSRYDLYSADEVFLTNSGWGVLPVVRVEGHIVGSGSPGPTTAKARSMWLRAVREEA